jgi:(S)-mandelate dehydrogenase
MSMKPVNVEDYRIRAQSRLPKIIFDYLECGADDEIGMNREIFDGYRLMPRRLVDVSKRDIGVEPFSRQAGIPFVLSTASNASVEDVAAASKGDLWFQLYIVSASSRSRWSAARTRSATLLSCSRPMSAFPKKSLCSGI